MKLFSHLKYIKQKYNSIYHGLANRKFFKIFMLKNHKSDILRISLKVSSIENHYHIKEQVLRPAVTVDDIREKKPSFTRFDLTRFDDSRIKLVALPRRESES